MSDRLTDLHPSGFAAVPLALMVDERAGREHLLAYAGIASVRPASATPGGPREIPNKYLQAAARLSYHVLQRAVGDLEAWGYLDREQANGYPTRYTLLATQDVRAELEELAAEREAAHPEIAGHRGGRPPMAKPPRVQKPPRAQDARESRAQDARGFRSVLISEKEKEQQPLNNPLAPRTREGLELHDRDAYLAHRPEGCANTEWPPYFDWCKARADAKGDRGGLLPTMLRNDLALYRDEQQERRHRSRSNGTGTPPALAKAKAAARDACDLCDHDGRRHWTADGRETTRDDPDATVTADCDHAGDPIAATA